MIEECIGTCIYESAIRRCCWIAAGTPIYVDRIVGHAAQARLRPAKPLVIREGHGGTGETRQSEVGAHVVANYPCPVVDSRRAHDNIGQC